ncbi:metallophosphoesterase [Candidatus Pelagibacter sp.]|nr:metallophosphoesterase [Candidatus Pelagibacter sp.]
MKNYINFLTLAFFFLVITNNSYSLEKNSYFIGHAYGYHGNLDIPDKSLSNFLKKNNPNFIIFGGDLTEKEENFEIFKNYFKNFRYLAVRGNHDGELFKKIPFWRYKKINGYSVYNLDMNEDMIFEKKNLIKLSNTIIVQHYIWYLRLFSDLPHNLPNSTMIEKINYKIKLFNSIQIPIANSMYNSKIIERNEIKKINFGKDNIYLAGDCGAFKDRFSYAKTIFKSNTFICSGIGSGWANNVVNLNTLEPIFFDIDGNIINHECKETLGRLNNLVEFCLPIDDRADSLWDLLKKETS